MPLAYFRRPLAWATILLMVLIAWLKASGRMRPETPQDLLRYTRRPRVAVTARVVSGFSPKVAGDRFWLSLVAVEGRPQRPVKVLAYLPRADPETASLRPGMIVRLEGRLRRPLRPLWPGASSTRPSGPART